MRLKVAQQGNKENVGRAHAPQQPVPAGHVPEPHGMTGSLLGLQRTHGNRFVQRLLNGVTIQRKCACGGTCTKCQSESAQQEQHTWQHILQRTGSGQPLESGVMEFMETRFGEDFSEVRVHTDTHTAQTAQRLNAVAYTVGRDIFFGSGQYHPQTMEGKQLLAHELTHVVQQQHGIQRQQVGGIPGDQYEQEADKIAHTVVRRKRPSKPEAIADERMAQGTSWVNLQDPRGHVASIFFATNQTNLDDQDKRVLAKVYNAYRPGLPLFKVHMLFIGYVDYRGTEKYNSTLRHQRAQAVAKYFSVLADPRIDESRNYSWDIEPGTELPQIGSTSKELSPYRRVDIFASPIIHKVKRYPEPEPERAPVSEFWKARITASVGGGLVFGGSLLYIEIVDLSNYLRMYYRYTGFGLSALLGGASAYSEWRKFTTSLPIGIEDFTGPAMHVAFGVQLKRGPSVDVFHLFGPTFHAGAKEVNIAWAGLWEEGWALSGGIEPFGFLELKGAADKVSRGDN